MCRQNYLVSFLIGFLFFTLNPSLKSQIATTGVVGQNPQSLLENVLIGEGIIISDVKFNWTNANITSNQIGTFTNGSAFTTFPFERGIIMTTGGISVAHGPNNSGSARVAPTGTTTVIDPDLQSLVSQTLKSTSALEFKFYSASPFFQFDYIFASEEYPEFVCSTFNDVFGFFLEGPDPVTGIVTKRNIALIPGTGLPVAINTVNPGTPGGGYPATGCTSLNYSSYYITNPTNNPHIQFDGYTTALTAYADLMPCTFYDIKLSIANVSDQLYDSGVFLKAQSFASQTISIAKDFTLSNVDTLIEGCNDLTLTFTVDPPATDMITINLDIRGTATNGIDYESIPDMIFIPFGGTSTQLVIRPLVDNVIEGTEYIEIIASIDICDYKKSDTVRIALLDYTPIVLTSFDSTVCDIYEKIDLPLEQGYLPLNITWTPDNISNITESGTYQVIAEDRWGCGRDTATINITVKPFIGLNVSHTSTIPGMDTLINDCNGITVHLDLTSPATEAITAYISNLVVGSTGEPYFLNLPTDVLFAPGESSKQFQVTLNPDVEFDGVKTLKLYFNFDFCGQSSDSIVIPMIYNKPVVLSSVDTTVCGVCDYLNVPLQQGAGPFQISWSPTTSLDRSNALTTSTRITRSTLYTVIAADRWGCTKDTALVDVVVNPVPSPHFTYNPHRGCDSITVRFTSTTTPADADLFWDFGNGETSTEQNPTSSYTVGSYNVTLRASTFTDCEATYTLPNAVEVGAYPEADFTFLPEEVLNGRPVSFMDLSTGNNIVSYSWSFGDGSGDRIQNPTHTYHVEGNQIFDVYLTVTNAFGCSDTQMHPVAVADNFAFWAPNAFTPDQNGTNDVFTPMVFDVFDYELRIFDRFGSCIFHTNEINLGWNGAYNGILCPEGVYIWKVSYVKYSDPNMRVDKTGAVLLVR